MILGVAASGRILSVLRENFRVFDHPLGTLPPCSGIVEIVAHCAQPWNCPPAEFASFIAFQFGAGGHFHGALPFVGPPKISTFRKIADGVQCPPDGFRVVHFKGFIPSSPLVVSSHEGNDRRGTSPLDATGFARFLR